MPDTATALARLRHDVAKYVVRVAQNVRDEVPDGLIAFLLQDVEGAYEPYLRDRAHLSEGTQHACDAAFEAIDRLKAKARAGEQDALRSVVEHARAIARAIESEG